MSNKLDEILSLYPDMRNSLEDVALGEVISQGLERDSISNDIFNIIISIRDNCTYIQDKLEFILNELIWTCRDSSNGAVSVQTILVNSIVYNALKKHLKLQDQNVQSIKINRNATIKLDQRLDACNGIDILAIGASKHRPISYKKLIYIGKVNE